MKETKVALATLDVKKSSTYIQYYFTKYLSCSDLYRESMIFILGTSIGYCQILSGFQDLN